MKVDYEQALMLLGNGATYQEVADEFGCTKAALYPYFGPEKRRKAAMDEDVEGLLMSHYTRRIRASMKMCKTKEDFQRDVKEILGSMEACLVGVMIPNGVNYC